MLLTIRHKLILQKNLQSFLARFYMVHHNYTELSKWNVYLMKNELN